MELWPGGLEPPPAGLEQQKRDVHQKCTGSTGRCRGSTSTFGTHSGKAEGRDRLQTRYDEEGIGFT
eukprot:scaffold5220_cov215-Skeletonema_marinoi.AAC.2